MSSEDFLVCLAIVNGTLSIFGTAQDESLKLCRHPIVDKDHLNLTMRMVATIVRVRMKGLP